ncbi:hypothetical protein SKAU_G00261780 [Synaphobranchus kaupii]|uniref:Uncharacterized protein n=1 Tax=Synaphobranchus kaupii TaxID=118154 RepID=A0A9Q1EYF8_SYNKA|nr:hypothetical protein SKAU_G00261780 [Synaphobranchus kaupii]
MLETDALDNRGGSASEQRGRSAALSRTTGRASAGVCRFGPGVSAPLPDPSVIRALNPSLSLTSRSLRDFPAEKRTEAVTEQGQQSSSSCTERQALWEPRTGGSGLNSLSAVPGLGRAVPRGAQQPTGSCY